MKRSEGGGSALWLANEHHLFNDSGNIILMSSTNLAPSATIFTTRISLIAAVLGSEGLSYCAITGMAMVTRNGHEMARKQRMAISFDDRLSLTTRHLQ